MAHSLNYPRMPQTGRITVRRFVHLCPGALENPSCTAFVNLLTTMPDREEAFRKAGYQEGRPNEIIWMYTSRKQVPPGHVTMYRITHAQEINKVSLGSQSNCWHLTAIQYTVLNKRHPFHTCDQRPILPHRCM